MHGNVFEVHEKFAGSLLAADVTTGSTTVYVYDIQRFNADGGRAVLKQRRRHSPFTYTGIADGYDDSGETDPDWTQFDAFGDPVPALIGVTGITNDFTADVAEVRVRPYTRTRYAEVQESDEDDTITVRVPHHLRQLLPVGTRDTKGQEHATHVLFHWDEHEFVITDVLGKRTRIHEDHANPHRVARYTLLDAALPSAGFVSDVLDDINGVALACRVRIDLSNSGAAPTAGPAQFQLLLNGSSQKTLIVKNHHKRSRRYRISPPDGVAFTETDAWTWQVDDPSNITGPVHLLLFYKQDNE